MNWYFRPLTHGELTRDPIIGEFFSTDVIDNPAEALVREGIQNALDASQARLVSVRIFLATGEHALTAEKAGLWIGNAWSHIQTSGNGLREPPGSTDICPFLVFEDFGTTGLQGDEIQPFDEPNTANSFFYFFRAEGRSGKGEQDRGRWGVGKHMFPRSSQINTFFGLTVRADDQKRFLMGRTILKSHRLNTTHYSPDGYFGESGKDNLTLPIADVTTLDSFCMDFRLKRKMEPGLSIVVPFVDPDISVEHLKEAVVSGYFHPILAGKLVVTIETPDATVEINSRTLVDVGLSFEGDASNKILPLIELAEWAALCPDQDVVNLNPCDADRPIWSNELIPPELTQLLREKLEKGGKIALRANLTVREKGKQPRPSHFNIYLWQDGYEDGHPVFIREGIIISDVRALRTRGVRAIVVIEDKPIATLLGDSENPAHTQWQKDSSNFKGKYVHGPSYIDFVTKAVSRLVHALSAQEEEEDKSLLLDFFSLPSDKSKDDPKRREDKPTTKPGKKSQPPPPPPEPRKKPFKVLKVPGGFAIVSSEEVADFPVQLEVKCAYDTRKGSPLKKYEVALKSKAPDFRLGYNGVKVNEKAGAEIVGQENNLLRIKIIQAEFRVVVTGFDENRDLFVDARMEEEDNDSEV
jgi:hypothetical protein